MPYEPLKYPVIKFGIKHFTTYDFIEFNRSSTAKKSVNSMNNLNAGKVQHFGVYSQSNIKKHINNWIFTQELAHEQFNLKYSKSPRHHTFITLTLPAHQLHCDKVIKREVLNYFLIDAKRRWKIHNYMWKAEAQQNGNIHFHLLTDKFIDHTELRTIWNRSVNRLGYVDWFCHYNNHFNPNSTDIHALKKVQNVQAYFCKYFVKEEKTRPICGNTWYASDNIKKLSSFSQIIDQPLREWIRLKESEQKTRLKIEEKFSVAFCEDKINYNTLPTWAKKELRQKVKENLNHLLTI